MIRNYNHLSYDEIIFDPYPLKAPRLGRRSSKRGTLPYRFDD
jgi:hypothetical protein